MHFLNRNKSGLFLMELIVVILFFCAASAVCIKLFFAGETLSRKSAALTNAVIQTQSAAQCIKNSNGKTDILKNQFPTEEKNGKLTIYFDSSFSPTINEKIAEFALTVRQDTSKQMITSQIQFVSNTTGEVLYTLESKKFTQEAAKK